MKSFRSFFLVLLLLLTSYSPFLPSTEPWEVYKEKTATLMSMIPGWCSKQKALALMDLIQEKNCQNCVEIGVFAGSSFFPIARALQYKKTGKAHAIDAWNGTEAVKGLEPKDPNYIWWKQQNLEDFLRFFRSFLSRHKLDAFCSIYKETSQEAVRRFRDSSIDFIHFDGNHLEESVFQDVTLYFPKIQDGGYIVLSDPHWFSMRRAVIFLLERCSILSPFTGGESFLIMQKKKEMESQALSLMNIQRGTE